MHQNPSSARAPALRPADPDGGAYDAPPDPLVGWLGRGIPPPHSPSRSTPTASRFSGPLNTKSWLRQWLLLCLFTCSDIWNNLSCYKVVISMNRLCLVSTFHSDNCLIRQWNARCNDAVSINRSINLIIDYFNNRLIDFNGLIVAAPCQPYCVRSKKEFTIRYGHGSINVMNCWWWWSPFYCIVYPI